MLFYKYDHFFSKSNDAKFDEIHTPGSTTPFSGMYRCTGCEREIVSEAGKPLPPQNYHEHGPAKGPIRWQLAVD